MFFCKSHGRRKKWISIELFMYLLKSLSGVQLFETPCHGISQARILEWVAIPFSRDIPNPGIEPRFSTLQADSLPAEPKRKPQNTGVGGLSLLQWIFPNQELNEGSLHCRRILYQLSYQGSPMKEYMKTFHKSIMSK